MFGGPRRAEVLKNAVDALSSRLDGFGIIEVPLEKYDALFLELFSSRGARLTDKGVNSYTLFEEVMDGGSALVASAASDKEFRCHFL